MIWGEIVNSVRALHFDLIREFNLDPKVCTKDVELNRDGFPFPAAIDDFDEWDEFIPDGGLEDIIPLHPVERVIVEGPLLPIQKVSILSKSEVDVLFASIINLEKEWCEKTKVNEPRITAFIEKNLVVQAMKISTRLGFLRLSTV